MTRIYTVGYSGSSHADLQAIVQETGAQLVDIRLSARSRRPEWTGDALRTLLGERYTAAPELGNLNYATGGPIKLANPALGVRRLRGVLAERPVILLCACADWQTCHRLAAATYLADELGLEVEHLPGRHARGTQAASGATIKVLTLNDPWATLVAIGAKKVESRSWGTPYRGPLLIHSSKRFSQEERFIAAYTPAFRDALLGTGIRALSELPRGAIIARCHLANCIRTEEIVAHLSPQEQTFGDYSPNRWAWVLKDVEALPEPVPARGSLGLWEVPAEGLLPPA